MKRICLLIVLFWPPFTEAQTTYAVVVGVSDYLYGQPRNGDLNFPDDDARKFYNYLISPAGGSVPVSQVHLLIGKQATRANILAALRVFARAHEVDRVIFFFSGHGSPGLFLAYDSEPTGRDALPHQSVKEAFRSSRARTKLCIADACHSGSIRTKPQRVPVGPTALRDEPNVIVFMSSRPNEPSQELGQLRQSVFTYFLLKGLMGMADTNRDRRVSIYELYAYTRDGVGRYTKGQQTPIVYGRFPKELVLAKVAL